MDQIFISYPHEDKSVAEDIAQALKNRDWPVFLDQKSLPVGGNFRFELEKELQNSTCAILLLSPEYFEQNSYCRSELEIMQELWPKSANRIFPVMLRAVNWKELPSYIKSVTIIDPEGNVVTDVVRKLEAQIERTPYRKLQLKEQIADLDIAWEREKDQYMIASNGQKLVPEKSHGYFVIFFCTVMVVVAMFIARIANSISSTHGDDSIGYIFPMFILVPIAIGIYGAYYIFPKAEKYRVAKFNYETERAALEDKLRQVEKRMNE